MYENCMDMTYYFPKIAPDKWVLVHLSQTGLGHLVHFMGWRGALQGCPRKQRDDLSGFLVSDEKDKRIPGDKARGLIRMNKVRRSFS